MKKIHLEQVTEFRKAFNLPLFPKSSKNESLHLTLFNEEHKEFKDALKNNNALEMLDGLIDCMYVTTGAVLDIPTSSLIDEFKIKCNNIAFTFRSYLDILEDDFDNLIDEAFAEVHRSNMTKVPKCGNIIVSENGKILKPTTYEKPNLQPILDKYL